MVLFSPRNRAPDQQVRRRVVADRDHALRKVSVEDRRRKTPRLKHPRIFHKVPRGSTRSSGPTKTSSASVSRPESACHKSSASTRTSIKHLDQSRARRRLVLAETESHPGERPPTPAPPRRHRGGGPLPPRADAGRRGAGRPRWARRPRDRVPSREHPPARPGAPIRGSPAGRGRWRARARRRPQASRRVSPAPRDALRRSARLRAARLLPASPAPGRSPRRPRRVRPASPLAAGRIRQRSTRAMIDPPVPGCLPHPAPVIGW